MIPKPFVIIQLRPENETSDNEFQSFLKYGKLNVNDVKRIRAERNGIPDINLKNYSAIMVGGSPFDISTPENKKSEIQKKIEKDFKKLLDKIIQNDFPFIGACSGSGILGNHCGAKITSKYSEPVGGVDIEITDVGKKDFLLQGFPSSFRALVGHKEACENVPKNAVLLASSKTCPVQMYRIKNNIYATQFHPEADTQAFILRIKTYKNYGYFPPENAEKLIESIKHEVITEPKKILERFVLKYKKMQS